MKWIFYLLVIVNLAMLAFLFSSPQPSSAYSQAAFKDVGDLKRVSDVELKVRQEFQSQKEAEKQRKRLAQSEEARKKELIRQQKEIEEARKQNKSVCRRVGPFPGKSDAESIASGLAQERHIAKLQETNDIETLGYWALLPAPGSKDDADKIIDTLRDKGMSDVQRLTEGENQNAISLGLFSTEINAKRQVRAVEKHGFLAIVKAKQEESRQFWVEFNQKPDFDFPLDRVRTNYPNVEIKSCNGIASL